MAELIDANLAGDTVIQIRFDYAVTIVTERSELRIQTEFELADEDGTHRIDPESSTPYANRILTALHQIVDSCEYTESGGIQMVFAGGMAITIDSDREFEAWNLAIREDRLVVSKVGGGIAAWDYSADDPGPS